MPENQSLLSNFASLILLIAAIFKSLLYEACGRIVNPIFGSAGLLSSGSWHLCQVAVEAVLRGAPITPVSSESAFDGVSPLLKACDIRHVAKIGNSSVSDQLHKVKPRSQFKRSAAKPKQRQVEPTVEMMKEVEGSLSRESGVSEHRSRGGSVTREAESSSVGTVEASLVKNDKAELELADDGAVELELTLGWGPTKRSRD